MHLFNQAPPVHRRSIGAAPAARLRPQQVRNTCGCSGDCNYDKCKVTRNDCDPGFFPDCDCGAYNCGCICKPA